MNPRDRGKFDPSKAITKTDFEKELEEKAGKCRLCGRPLEPERMVFKELNKCGKCQLLALAAFVEMDDEEDSLAEISSGEQGGARLRDAAETLWPNE